MDYLIQYLVAVNLFVTLHCEVKSTYYQQTANKRYTNISRTADAVSVLSCGRLCHDETWCKIFNYHTADQFCELGVLTTGNNVQMESGTGWDMYTKAEDECESSPCQNSGTCTDHIWYYECSCTDGWGGTNCDTITGCISGWRSFENACYYFDTTFRSQPDAQNNCGTLLSVAHLSDVKSSDEQDFIVSYITETNTNNAVFIGGMYDASSGQYFWTDGQSLGGGFNHWSNGEPNNLDEECIALWPGLDYYWVDYTCFSLAFSMCEYEII